MFVSIIFDGDSEREFVTIFSKLGTAARLEVAELVKFVGAMGLNDKDDEEACITG